MNQDMSLHPRGVGKIFPVGSRRRRSLKLLTDAGEAASGASAVDDPDLFETVHHLCQSIVTAFANAANRSLDAELGRIILLLLRQLRRPPPRCTVLHLQDILGRLAVPCFP